MFAAPDVCYDEPRSVARAAWVLFADPQSDAVTEEAITTITTIADYEPGHFYRRELPCIEAVLATRLAGLDAVLIDGYVYLSNDGDGAWGGMSTSVSRSR